VADHNHLNNSQTGFAFEVAIGRSWWAQAAIFGVEAWAASLPYICGSQGQIGGTDPVHAIGRDRA